MSKCQAEKKFSILIVDDWPENLRYLTEIMSEHGYYVRPVPNGKLALFAAQEIPPDLILLDILMPDMDGYDVCKALKQNEKTKDIPIIFLSAMTETESVVKGFELGAEDYIRKPFNPTEVLSRIKTHLELNFSKKMIEEKNHKQKELIHVLCHDLMNSIGAVHNVLEMVKTDPDNCEIYVDIVRKAACNGVEIIKLVRQISSLDEGKMQLNLAVYSLKELIEQALEMLKDKFDKKFIQIEMTIAEDIFVKVESVSFINSVIINLLTNAVKFSFNHSQIIIKAENTATEVIFSIQDFGVGMPPSLCEDIFKINKPTTRTGTNGEQGTGFGMPLVKNFVEAYGGTISFVSCEKTADNEQHGTTFFITLPKVEERPV